MANINDEFAAASEAYQRELNQLGTVSDATAAKLKVAAAGVADFDKKMSLATAAAGSLVKTFTTYNRAVYDGIKSYKDLASTTDALATSIEAVSAAIAFILPIGRIAKIAVAGLGLLAGELTRQSKVIGEQLSNIRDGFDGLAQYGATASRGMSEVFEGLQRLGLGVQEATHMVKLMGDNADVVTLFSSTMAKGQRQFEDTVEGMRGFRGDLLSLGIPIKEQTTATLGYLRLQKQLTMGTKLQMDMSARAVTNYVKEVDLLTRITGQTKEQQQKLLEDAMQEATYAAARDELAEKNANSANLLDIALRLAAKGGKEATDAIKGMAGGVLSNEAAIKMHSSSQGKYFDLVQRIRSGEIQTTEEVVEGMREAFKATAQFGKVMRGTYALGVMEDKFVKYHTTSLAKASAETLSLKDAQQEQKDLLENLDPVQKKYQQDLIKFHDQMLRNQKAVQDLVPAYQASIGGVTDGLGTLTNAAMAAAGALYRLANPNTNTAPTATELSGAASESKTSAANVSNVHADVMSGKYKNEADAGVGRIEQAEQQRKINLDKSMEMQRRQGHMLGSKGGSIFSGGRSDTSEDSLNKYIDFGSNSGDRAHFDQLNSNTKSAFIAMASDYYSMTKSKLKITSAARSYEEQKKLHEDFKAGRSRFPAAEPGKSLHEVGNALDLPEDQVSALIAKGLLSQYGFKPLAGDPVHIFMRDGGIIPATPGGTTVTAGEAGTAEAFVPLKNGTIPVSFSDAGMDKVVEAIVETQKQNNSMLYILDQILRTQTSTNDISDRMLRIAQN